MVAARSQDDGGYSFSDESGLLGGMEAEAEQRRSQQQVRTIHNAMFHLLRYRCGPSVMRPLDHYICD